MDPFTELELKEIYVDLCCQRRRLNPPEIKRLRMALSDHRNENLFKEMDAKMGFNGIYKELRKPGVIEDLHALEDITVLQKNDPLTIRRTLENPFIIITYMCLLQTLIEFLRFYFMR